MKPDEFVDDFIDWFLHLYWKIPQKNWTHISWDKSLNAWFMFPNMVNLLIYILP